MGIESIRRYAESGFWVDSSEEDLERIRFLLSEVDRLTAELKDAQRYFDHSDTLRLKAERERDTARAEVEKLRERAAADVAKLYAERDESDRVGYARLQEIERLRAEVQSLRELVAECRPVVEAVRKAQANSCCDKACAHCGEMLRMKLPAMEGGE